MNITTLLDEYTEPTILVDSKDQLVLQKALELTNNCKSVSEKVKHIYHFVRDEIPYTFTNNMQKASDVLKDQVGQCNTKATLTIALLRAINIPARYHCGSISKVLFKGIIPKWAYLFTPKKIPGHCWTEVYINDRWTAIENVVDLALYEGIQHKMVFENQKESIGCGLSTEKFQKQWDGESDILMQSGALVKDAGTFSNADEYLNTSEYFLSPLKYWIKAKIIKEAMNKQFSELRSYGKK